MKDDGLINAKLTTTGSGNVSGFAEGLTAEGRRRIGDWPSPESVLPRLAELLESAVQNEDSQERKEPLRALLGALGQVTTGGLGNVVGTLIGQAAGVT